MGAPLGPIGLIPPGLTNLLAIKQLGRLPDQLLGDYQPSIELRDWMFEGRREDEQSIFALTSTLRTASLTTGAAGFQILDANGNVATPAQVPNGQIWYVEQFTCTAFNVASGDSIRFAPGILAPTELMPLAVGPETQDTSAARVHWCVAWVPRAFWAPPGTQFGVILSDILSVGGIQVRGTMRATRMQA